MSLIRQRKPLGIVRQLPADDPRSLDHPSHREKWLALARALGRLDARKDFEAIHGKPPPQGTPNDFRRKIEGR
jgi:hypothetical protein